MIQIVFGRLRLVGAAQPSLNLPVKKSWLLLTLSTSWKAFSVYTTIATATYV